MEIQSRHKQHKATAKIMPPITPQQPNTSTALQPIPISNPSLHKQPHKKQTIPANIPSYPNKQRYPSWHNIGLVTHHNNIGL